MRILVALLFFVCGCTSYYEIAPEDVNTGKIPSERAIRVIQRDGKVIESGAYRHIVVEEPVDLVVGTGTDRKSGRSFSGTIRRADIDSSRQIQIENASLARETYFLVWLRNKTTLAFPEYDYLNMTPEHQPGLWCAGTMTDGDHARPFKGRIDLSDITGIETKEITILHPSLPSLNGPTAGEYQWTNLGLGFALPVGAAFLGSYSFLSSSTLYSVRFTAATSLNFPGANEASRSAIEIAALYGLGFKSRFFLASVSGGISYVNGSEERYPDVFRYSTVSFPLDLELAITPSQSFGIAAKIFSTSNPLKSWGGFVVCLQFGL